VVLLSQPQNYYLQANGVSFNLKTVINGYTKMSIEMKKDNAIDLIVAIFSVLGGAFAVGNGKRVIEWLYDGYSDRQKRKRSMRSVQYDETQRLLT